MSIWVLTLTTLKIVSKPNVCWSLIETCLCSNEHNLKTTKDIATKFGLQILEMLWNNKMHKCHIDQKMSEAGFSHHRTFMMYAFSLFCQVCSWCDWQENRFEQWEKWVSLCFVRNNNNNNNNNNNITERRATRAYYYQRKNHTYATTHTQPQILTTTHSAPRNTQTGCHSVGVAAAGWLEFGSEYRCVRRAEIEEAPNDGKWGPLAWPMFR